MDVSFFTELKRRNVFRVAAAYIVGAWLVIQVAETVFPVYGLSDGVIRLVITLLAIGFVPAIVFSWVFELTPEGLKKEKDVDRSQSITPQTGKKLDRAIIVVLAIAVGYFAIDKFVLDPMERAATAEQVAEQVEQAREAGRAEALIDGYDDRSIAVLPFVNMSGDAANEYFSDGISEELLNLLAQIPELRVISRSSAFSFKGQNIEIPEIARRLNVAHVLEGSVRKSGDRVRITAQLIEARSDTHLWSQTWDRTLDDIFAIQDEIAAQVVDRLRVQLLGDKPHVEATDPEAYALFLQARYLASKVNAETLAEAEMLLERALEIDPDYAVAWNALGNLVSIQAGRGMLPIEAGYARARAALDRALAIDPDYAAAHANLGWIAMNIDLGQAARHIERALALDPTNPLAIRYAAVLLRNLNRLDAAIALDEYAVVHDPVNPIGFANLGFKYLYAGRWDDAIASYRDALRLSPGYIGAQYNIGVALLLSGRPEAARDAMLEERFAAFRQLGLAMVWHTLGQPAASDAELQAVIDEYEHHAAYNIAYVYAWRGEADLAFAWLDKAVEYGDPGLAETPGWPLFENLRDDPRWLEFMRRNGYAPEQLAAIEFEIRLPEVSSRPASSQGR
ncbi:MAG: tetratricopeptide repeat protein [Xanthomonadales bacterium]